MNPYLKNYVQGTILSSLVGQQDERSISGFQTSDKGMFNDRIRHYKVLVREVQISFSRKWCTAKEEADVGWILRGRTKDKHISGKGMSNVMAARVQRTESEDNLIMVRGEEVQQVRLKRQIKDTHDFVFWTT